MTTVPAGSPRRARRVATRVALAAGICGALLTGCAGGGASGEREEAAATTSPPATGSGAPEDLAAGLLPAEAFGPEATVVAITLEQLQAGAGLAGSLGELQITPPECADVVQGTQPQFDQFPELAAQSATSAGTTTVEVLMRGGPTAGVTDRLLEAVQACPEAQVSSPRLGQATVTFQPVELDALGEGSAALLYTTVLTQPGGAQTTVPGLIGMVEDGDRLLTLMSLAGGAPDTGAFTALLRQAYEAQAEALD